MSKTKLKTHKGAAKRFKVTGTGKLVRRKASGSHLLTHKSSGRKRVLKQAVVVDKANEDRINKLLPYS